MGLALVDGQSTDSSGKPGTLAVDSKLSKKAGGMALLMVVPMHHARSPIDFS